MLKTVICMLSTPELGLASGFWSASPDAWNSLHLHCISDTDLALLADAIKWCLINVM